jgi:hypothetical protein
MVAIRGRLEAEGIECYVKDELTVQIYNFYSNAIGGIRLEVRESDYEKARQILIETGFLKEEVEEPSKFWAFVDGLTKNIPFIKNARLELRLLIVVGLLLAMILFSFIGILTATDRTPQQSNYAFITNPIWCVSHINFKDKDYIPVTIDTARVKFIYGCEEKIHFRKDNTISIPGFNTFRAYGKWQLNQDQLRIYDLDTLQHIFEGNYKIETGNFELTLHSENTTIYCYNGH